MLILDKYKQYFYDQNISQPSILFQSKMKHLLIFTFIILLQSACNQQNLSIMKTAKAENQEIGTSSKSPITLVVHGGAGTILKENMTPELEQEYIEKLTEALHMGFEILENGGSSIDAVQKTINILEDSSPLQCRKRCSIYQ